jgi:hypothetical protein
MAGLRYRKQDSLSIAADVQFCVVSSPPRPTRVVVRMYEWLLKNLVFIVLIFIAGHMFDTLSFKLKELPAKIECFSRCKGNMKFTFIETRDKDHDRALCECTVVTTPARKEKGEAEPR